VASTSGAASDSVSLISLWQCGQAMTGSTMTEFLSGVVFVPTIAIVECKQIHEFSM
jgi:hypothetical protein